MSIDYSGLAGGIGKGLMLGTDFVARRNDAKDRKAYQDEVLGMQQQTHDARMQQFDYQKANMERQQQMQDAVTKLISTPEYQAADPYRQGKMAMKEMAPFATPEMQLQFTNKIADLDRLIGRDTLSKAIAFKDMSGVAKLLQERDPTFRHEMRGDNGDEFWASRNGAPLQKIDLDGVAAYLGGVDHYEQEQWKGKKADAELGRQYKQAQIDNVGSQTARNYASANKIGTAASGVGKQPIDIDLTTKTQKYILDGLPEGMLEIPTSTGKPISVPSEEAAAGIQVYFDRLREDNPGVNYSTIRNEAIHMYKQANGGMVDGGNYEPTYELNPQGREVPYIRTKDGLNLVYYSPQAKRDIPRLLDAQDRWVAGAEQQGVVKHIQSVLSNETNREYFIQGLTNPRSREMMEAAYPGIYDHARMLYARGLLDLGDVTDQGYREARELIEKRKFDRLMQAEQNNPQPAGKDLVNPFRPLKDTETPMLNEHQRKALTITMPGGVYGARETMSSPLIARGIPGYKKPQG